MFRCCEGKEDSSRQLRDDDLRFVCHASSRPHPAKSWLRRGIPKSDSHMAESQFLGVTAGISDVWETSSSFSNNRRRLNPGDFPRELLDRIYMKWRLSRRDVNFVKECLARAQRNGAEMKRRCTKLGLEPPNISSNHDDLSLAILAEAALGCTSEGASTCAVAWLELNSRLRILSIGDSAVLVLRRNTENGMFELITSSSARQYGFSCPFQLSHLAGYPWGEDAVYSNVLYRGISKTIDVCVGDVVIVGTDGIFDNIFVRSVVEAVNAHSCRNAGAVCTQSLAQSLLDEAHNCAWPIQSTSEMRERLKKPANKQADILTRIQNALFPPQPRPGPLRHERLQTPFSVQVGLYTGLFHCGGKPGDASVVVGIVSNGMPRQPPFHGVLNREFPPERREPNYLFLSCKGPVIPIPVQYYSSRLTPKTTLRKLPEAETLRRIR